MNLLATAPDWLAAIFLFLLLIAAAEDGWRMQISNLTSGAIAIGALAGVGCSMALSLKYRFGYDDSLDVVGVHLVGGLIGTLSIGLFADVSLTGSPDTAGLLAGGGLAQLGRQALGAGAVLVYSFLVTWLLAQLLNRTMGLRIPMAAEAQGSDVGEHAETGYDLSKAQYSSYNVGKTLWLPNDASKDENTEVPA